MTVEIQIEWYTPAGKVRNVPMYSTTIENRYLRASRTIRGTDHRTVSTKAIAQLEKWAEQEGRQRETAAKQDALERGEAEAAELDAEAREIIESLRALLRATLAVDDRIDWNELRDRREPAPFTFAEAAPVAPNATPQVLTPTFERHPPKPWYASFWPGAESTWHERCAAIDMMNRARAAETEAANHGESLRCAELLAAHAGAVTAWTQRRDAARQLHEAEVARFLDEQRSHNQRVDAFKAAFEKGVPGAVTEYLRGVFERSEYPECFKVTHSVEFASNGLASVVVEVPPIADFPTTAGYSFTRSKCEAKPVLLKKREHAELYEQAVAQVVLRTMHEIFEADYVPVVREAEVSAFVSYVDPTTGRDARDCKAAVAATREAFLAFNLERVDPVACVKSLSQSVIMSR